MRNWLCRVLKVPPEPALPPGSHDSARVFRAGRNYYRLLLLQWGFKQASVIVGIIVSLIFLGNVNQGWSKEARNFVNAAEWIGIASFLAQIPFTYLMVRLVFDLRWYVVTDRSIRIRSGLLHVREMTMTFTNIQHLTVRQGPLQRMLGLYDLQVRTAGGGGDPDQHRQPLKSTVAHIGHFHGVENAPAIRDLILARMKRVRDAGLGDPDDAGGECSDDGDAMQAFRAAMTQVRDEIGKLGAALR